MVQVDNNKFATTLSRFIQYVPGFAAVDAAHDASVLLPAHVARGQDLVGLLAGILDRMPAVRGMGAVAFAGLLAIHSQVSWSRRVAVRDTIAREGGLILATHLDCGVVSAAADKDAVGGTKQHYKHGVLPIKCQAYGGDESGNCGVRGSPGAASWPQRWQWHAVRTRGCFADPADTLEHASVDAGAVCGSPAPPVAGINHRMARGGNKKLTTMPKCY